MHAMRDEHTLPGGGTYRPGSRTCEERDRRSDAARRETAGTRDPPRAAIARGVARMLRSLRLGSEGRTEAQVERTRDRPRNILRDAPRDGARDAAADGKANAGDEARRGPGEPYRRRWEPKGYTLALKACGYQAAAHEELLPIPGHANVIVGSHSASEDTSFHRIGTERGQGNVLFDMRSRRWIDRDWKKPIGMSPPVAALGVLPLLRPRPVSETFPEAWPVPKKAFCFWAGAALPQKYLKNVRHNARILHRCGYTFTVVLDIDDALFKQTRQALRRHALRLFQRDTIAVERWSDQVRSLLAFGRRNARWQSIIVDALGYYEAIADLGFYASAADLARYLRLFRLGGLYIDMDDVLPEAFDGVLLADSHIVWSPLIQGGPHVSPFCETRFLNNNLLAAQAESPILAQALLLSSDRLTRGGYAALVEVAKPSAGLSDADVEGREWGKEGQALRERAKVIFTTTGPALLTDAVRETAPGFDAYLQDIWDYFSRVDRVLRYREYFARIDRIMLPLEAAFQIRNDSAASWASTPTPRRRALSPASSEADESPN